MEGICLLLFLYVMQKNKLNITFDPKEKDGESQFKNTMSYF